MLPWCLVIWNKYQISQLLLQVSHEQVTNYWAQRQGLALRKGTCLACSFLFPTCSKVEMWQEKQKPLCLIQWPWEQKPHTADESDRTLRSTVTLMRRRSLNLLHVDRGKISVMLKLQLLLVMVCYCFSKLTYLLWRLSRKISPTLFSFFWFFPL